MSALATPDPEAATPSTAPSSAGRPTASGRLTLFRLPGFVGGEPSQPVPRDLVAVGHAGRDAAVGVDFWVDDVDAAAERARRARRRRDLPARRTTPSGRTRRPRRPAGRGRSRSAAWCPHEHDRGRQPRHARRRHAGARPPRRGPPRRLRARRLGRRSTSTTSGRVHGRADGPGRRRAAVRPLDLRQDAERLDAAAGGQPGPPGARAQHEVRRLALGRPGRVDELGAAAGRRGRDRRATSKAAPRATS